MPFKDGVLFSFNNLFLSLDLIDSLLTSFNTIVVEFIDAKHAFK
jgi:hypothetical protein